MKLYWRVKINGKWTWRPASQQFMSAIEETLDVYGIHIDHPLFIEGEEE